MTSRDPRARPMRFCLFFMLAFSGNGLPKESASKSASHGSQVHKFYETGMRLVQEKRLDEAIQTFKQGLQADPNNVILLNAIGAAHSLKKDPEQAQGYFLKALSIDSQFAP